jgi:hypothetical protein
MSRVVGMGASVKTRDELRCQSATTPEIVIRHSGFVILRKAPVQTTGKATTTEH